MNFGVCNMLKKIQFWWSPTRVTLLHILFRVSAKKWSADWYPNEHKMEPVLSLITSNSQPLFMPVIRIIINFMRNNHKIMSKTNTLLQLNSIENLELKWDDGFQLSDSDVDSETKFPPHTIEFDKLYLEWCNVFFGHSNSMWWTNC